MNRLMIAVVFYLAFAASALAQQGPAEDTPVTLTFGELNAIVQARVAEANAAAAMRHLNEQIAKHAPKPPVSSNLPPAPPEPAK